MTDNDNNLPNEFEPEFSDEGEQDETLSQASDPTY